MTRTLRELKASLYKVRTVTTDEVEQAEEGYVGKYVFRDEYGQKFMWSSSPSRYQFEKAETAADADTLMFLCPACFEKNGGSVGTHRCMVTFAGRDVPPESGSRGSDGQPTRWIVQSGNTLDDLVLTPSILLTSGCCWHGFVGSSGIPPGHAG